VTIRIYRRPPFVGQRPLNECRRPRQSVRWWVGLGAQLGAGFLELRALPLLQVLWGTRLRRRFLLLPPEVMQRAAIEVQQRVGAVVWNRVVLAELAASCEVVAITLGLVAQVPGVGEQLDLEWSALDDQHLTARERRIEELDVVVLLALVGPLEWESVLANERLDNHLAEVAHVGVNLFDWPVLLLRRL